MEGEINSTLVERMKISTYGSFLAESLADWSKQVSLHCTAGVRVNRYHCTVLQELE